MITPRVILSAMNVTPLKMPAARPETPAGTPDPDDPDAWLRAFLEIEYTQRRRTLADIAEADLGMTGEGLRKHMVRLGIPRRTGGNRKAHARLGDRAWLTARYVDGGATMSEIASELGVTVAAVSRALRREQVRSRGPGDRRGSPALVAAMTAGQSERSPAAALP